MTTVFLFKSTNGKHLMTVKSDKEPQKDSIIELVNSEGKRKYRVVGVGVPFNSPEVFGEKEPVVTRKITCQPL